MGGPAGPTCGKSQPAASGEPNGHSHAADGVWFGGAVCPGLTPAVETVRPRDKTRDEGEIWAGGIDAPPLLEQGHLQITKVRPRAVQRRWPAQAQSRVTPPKPPRMLPR